MAAATVSSPKSSPQRPNVERDVADLIDHQNGDARETEEFLLEFSGAMGGGQAVDSLGGGGERDAVPGLAGTDAQSDGQLLARTRVFDRSQVVPWDHPDDFAIVSQARERACDRLAAWDLEEELFITELVVSELVIREVSAEPAYSTKAAVACSSSLS